MHSPPTSRHNEPEPTGPHPPRYWWLKRLTLLALLLALLLSGVWAAWAAEARRRLAAQLAPVVAAGEPINAASMNVPPVPDAENGAELYREAMRVLVQTVQSPAN